MNKKVYQNVNLNVVLQHEGEVSTDNCPKGILSFDAHGEVRFEEEIRKGRPARNPKLFDGEYVSMVRMQNGKYQFHMKTIKAEPGLDGREIAKEISTEIIKAFRFINA